MAIYGYACDDGLHSIRFQKYRTEYYCRINGFGTIDKWFSDTWRSLYLPFLERPEAKLMLMQLKPGDTIVCYEPERIFSRMKETAKICRLLHSMDISVAFKMFNDVDPATRGGAKLIQQCWERLLLQTARHPDAPRRRPRAKRFLGHTTVNNIPDMSEQLTAKACFFLATEYGVTPARVKNYLLRTTKNFKQLAQAAWLGFPRIRFDEEMCEPLIPPKDSDRDERRELYTIICETISESGMWLSAKEIGDLAGIPMRILVIRLAELVKFKALVKVKQDCIFTYHVAENFRIHEVPTFSIESLFQRLSKIPMSIMGLSRYYMVPPHVMVNIIHVMHFCNLLRRFRIKEARVRYRASNLTEPLNVDSITNKLNHTYGGRTFPLRESGANSFPCRISEHVEPDLDLADIQVLPCRPQDLQPNEQALAWQEECLDVLRARSKSSSVPDTPEECH